ncbi:TonB-dependent receptor [Parahaliea sp. F7430]|uniref:TonB-dependent receptor n=1 Tax=Sediminihaliea albiluteola TaxID=2758564 RepID=A0A7W2TUU0_9GAMM|nr:TonB-dependent receptor [Sediminihaliea albiluteola]
MISAQKKTESLQSAPLSVAAFSESMLESQGISSLSDLSLQTPSLQSYDFPTSSSNLSIYVRGFGNGDSQTLTIDNPVGLYIDGIYLARTSGATIKLLDLERIEILRGPQGTLFGRNSSSGAVSFISRKPSDEFGAKVEAGAGNFGSWNAGFTIDAPISSELRTQFSYLNDKTDGWVKNRGPKINPVKQSSENYYMSDQEAYRFALNWDILDNLDLEYSYDLADADGTPPYYQLNRNSRQKKTTNLLTGGSSYRYVLPKSNTESSGHRLALNWVISDQLELKSITGYRKMDERSVQNWADTLFYAIDLDWSTKSTSQEFQLLGNAFDNRLDFIAGYFYFKEKGKKREEQFSSFNGLEVYALDPLAKPAASQSALLGGTSLGATLFDTELTSQAVYAQASYTPDILDSRLTLTAGLRYTEDERDALRALDPNKPHIIFQPGTNSLDFDRTDYTLVLDFAITDEINSYARYATGYRAGGSGERTLSFDLTFDNEESSAFELGLKSELFDRRLRLNTALFFTDYDDLIVTYDSSKAGFSSFIENVNAGKAKVDGLELDIIGLIGEASTITFNYTYLDSEVTKVIVPNNSFLLAGPPASDIDLRGQDLSDTFFFAQAPKHAYSLAIDHSWTLTNGMSLDAHLNYSWRDSVYSSPRGLPVDELGLLNARISLSNIKLADSTLRVSAWGKNLTNESELIYDLQGLGFQFNRPPSYGIDLRLDI